MKRPQRPSLSSLTPAELRASAEQCRRSAKTAQAQGSREALLRLAERFERMAAARDRIGRSGAGQ